MANKGEPLTTLEKAAFRQMYIEGMTVQEIEKCTERSRGAITKYLKSEFPERFGNENIPAKLRHKLLAEMIKNGIEEKDARASINITDKKLHNPITEWDDEKTAALYQACLQNQSAVNLMVTKTMGGNNGVAIMTKAASDRGDEARNKSRTNATNMRDCIFQPQGN